MYIIFMGKVLTVGTYNIFYEHLRVRFTHIIHFKIFVHVTTLFKAKI